MGGPSTATRVLIVEDDEIACEIIATHLAREGIATTVAASVESALAAYLTASFDLVIVDINLPDGLGFDLVERLQRHRDCAVIYLTSRGDLDDRVRGLNMGADDYMVKPADLSELSARVNAVLRRHRVPPAPAPRVMTLAGWTLDLVRRELADPDGRLLPLTRGEFDVFAAIVQAGPTALDRDYLLEVVASAEAMVGPRTIDVLVSRIRTKLGAYAGAPQIDTVRGQGYVFKGPKEPPLRPK